MVACERKGFLSIEVQPCGSHASHVGCPAGPSHFPCYKGAFHVSLETSPKTLNGLGLQMAKRGPIVTLARLFTSYSNRPNTYPKNKPK